MATAHRPVRKEVPLTKMQLAGRKAWATIRKKRGLPEPKPRVRPKLVKRDKIKLPKDVKWASRDEVMMKSTVLVLSFSSLGNRRKIDTEDFVGSPEWFNTTKKLMDAEELTEIRSIYGECDRFIKRRALPTTIKDGVHILPNAVLEEVEAKLRETHAKVSPLVEKLISRRKPLIAEAKARLSRVKVGNEFKNFFNEEDYPTAEEIRAAVSIRWRHVYIDSAKNLQEVSPEIYRQELQKAQAEWKETRDTITQMMRTQFKAMIDHVIERLEPDQEGRTKTFREFEKLTEFVNTFEQRNVYGDAQMRVLTQEAKTMLGITDAAGLRSDTQTRDYVRHGFEEIQTLLDSMVETQHHRSIKLVD